MFHRYTIERRITICFILIKVVIFGRLTWCAIPQRALFLEDPVNATFDSFESHYSDESFTIKNVGCIIPAVRDMPIRKFLYESRNPNTLCKNYNNRLLDSNQTHIWIVKKNYKHYNIYNESNFVCCYESFYRPLGSRNVFRNMVDDRIQYLDCILFHNIIEVSNEFVRVTCAYKNKDIYKQYFLFTPKKPFTFNRDNPFKPLVNQPAYNIILMGIGSMSRQNFYRTMPNTLQLLKRYNTIELKGYNTVADDTFQNMIPVLVGMNSSELGTTCWTHTWSTLDNCPFIWERFKDIGYYTALVEDTSRFGMFNEGKFGFRGSPTDYYLHPFMHEAETLDKHENRKPRKSKYNDSVKKEHDHVSSCMGDKYYFEVLLNYVQRITTTLKKSKLFGLFWETSMSRENLNDPVKMDMAYVNLIKTMKTTGYLNDTILIFLSDHGMDIGDINLTKQGRIEQRLPFVFILVPPPFRNQYRLAYHNLKINMGRLTTPFDVHKTLADLIEMTEITENEILRRSTEFYTHDRGISLFLEIPRNRTCEMAGISSTWCACYNDLKLAPSTPIILEAVKHLTNHVNEVLKPHPECLKLIVDDIIIAKEMVAVYERSYEWRDFNIIVRMVPGGGIFETMMRYYNKKWSIVNHMKRLNFPGFRSPCVDDPDLKMFCYCK